MSTKPGIHKHSFIYARILSFRYHTLFYKNIPIFPVTCRFGGKERTFGLSHTTLCRLKALRWKHHRETPQFSRRRF
jgi:hypothetical protein